MKTSLTVTILALIHVIVFADVSDGFDRADTVITTNGSDIGVNWSNSDSSDKWRVSGNELVSYMQSAPAILYNTGQQTSCGNNNSFVLSANVSISQASVWSGIVFNYQNPSNYYVLRIKAGSTSYQVISVVDGLNDSVMVNENDSQKTFDVDTFYTLTVASDTVGEFDFTITETGSLAVLNSPMMAIDGGSGFHKNGYAGLYVSTTGPYPVLFDDFHISRSVSVLDGFNRPDTANSTDGANIGPGWFNSDSSDIWRIAGAELVGYLDSNPAILCNQELQTYSDGFSVSADVSVSQASVWGGLVFNYQNPSNYYMLRIKAGSKAYQMISVVDGLNDSVMINKGDALATFEVDTFYNLTVMSDTVGSFNFTITESGSSTVLNPAQTAVDAGSGLHQDGYGGVLVSTSGAYPVYFDDFRLLVDFSQEYSLWILNYSDLGSATNMTDDADNDGLNNLIEFAFGGNPLDSEDTGYQPSVSLQQEDGTNWLEYVYAERIDAGDRGLSYSVEQTTNLVPGVWTNAGSGFAGTGELESGLFNSVTNRVLADFKAQQFLRISVESD